MALIPIMALVVFVLLGAYPVSKTTFEAQVKNILYTIGLGVIVVVAFNYFQLV